MPNAKQLAWRIENLSTQIKELEAKKKQMSEKLLSIMNKKEVQNFTVDDGEEKILSVRNIEISKIKYDVEKARAVLGRDFKKYCNKTFEVDKVELEVFLYKYPEFKKELKKFLSANYSIAENKIEKAYELGELPMEKLKKFSEFSCSNYVKLQRIKRQEEDDE